MPQSLFTAQVPEVPNASDAAPGITRGISLQFSEAGQITHVRWWCPSTNSGVYTVGVWEVLTNDAASDGTGTLLASATHVGTPTPDAWNLTAVTPVSVAAMTKLYRIGVHNSQGRYVATNSFFVVPLTNDKIIAEVSGGNPIGIGTLRQGTFKIDAALAYPTNTGSAANYFVDVVYVPASEGALTPVTSTLRAKWRVYNSVTSDLRAKWRILTKVTSTLRAKWVVFAGTIDPITPNERYLMVQRRMTEALIKDDPTTAELIPMSRVRTPSGGFQEVNGAPRAAQTFKLSLLAYDQRPTITVAGVERLMDFHLIGKYDMQIAVGDHWTDDEGTTYEIAGFSEGWDYMTKAFVFRRVPREARP
jgi:hypothetical protein